MTIEEKLKVMRENLTGKAILVDKKPVMEPDLMRWSQWFETANRRVASTVINRRRHIDVSTIFLGLNHDWGPPSLNPVETGIWFETMIFGSSMDGYMERYRTYREAEIGHARIVGYARNARQRRRRRDSKNSR